MIDLLLVDYGEVVSRALSEATFTELAAYRVLARGDVVATVAALTRASELSPLSVSIDRRATRCPQNTVELVHLGNAVPRRAVPALR